MSKTMFIIGNGLSIALSKDFSLKKITEKFIERLDSIDREFLTELSASSGEVLNFDDFEANFTKIEAAYESLKRYNNFIKSSAGEILLKTYDLIEPDLNKHEEVIERIYMKYITYILELIHGNIHKDAISENLDGFVKFLINQFENEDKSYVFTLNYDLLVETILLDYLGTDKFADFCNPAGTFSGTDLEKYDFNPRRNKEWFGETNRLVELHHLHGSLSLFMDYTTERVIKLISGDISIAGVYDKIAKRELTLFPAIITGGGKSDKIVQYPFEFYYRSAKDLCDFGEPNSLYVIGYSFRDEHINDLIKRWMKNVEDYTKGLLIVDYKSNDKEKEEFIKSVRKCIRKRPPIPETCFEFGGVNCIRKIEGTKMIEKEKIKPALDSAGRSGSKSKKQSR